MLGIQEQQPDIAGLGIEVHFLKTDNVLVAELAEDLRWGLTKMHNLEQHCTVLNIIVIMSPLASAIPQPAAQLRITCPTSSSSFIFRTYSNFTARRQRQTVRVGPFDLFESVQAVIWPAMVMRKVLRVGWKCPQSDNDLNLPHLRPLLLSAGTL